MVIKTCFYYGGENFGDSINRIFIDFLADKKFSYSAKPAGPHYIVTGSVLHRCNSQSIVFGTGCISKTSRLQVPRNIIAVRGPLTRKRFIEMNVECPEVYGDPLILFPLLYNPSIEKKQKLIGIIPHYVDINTSTLNTLVENLKNGGYDVKIINILVGTKYKPFIDSIMECDTIISSSLHGMMMGLVYKKPSILVEFSEKVVGKLFKFNDFFAPLNIDYTVKNIYTLDLLNNIIKIDYINLKNLGDKLIDAAPFIDRKRKVVLKSKYLQE